MISNKIEVKITKFLKISPPNNSETVTNREENIGLDREVPRERYISKKRQKSIDDPILI